MRAAGAIAWAALLVGGGAWVADRVGLQQTPSPWLSGALAAVLALVAHQRSAPSPTDPRRRVAWQLPARERTGW